MVKRIKVAALVFFTLAFTSQVFGQTFTSSTYQTHLLELYTSEGCSSCPPTDNWFSSLQEQQGLWSDFIPVAFHVDYWDYIGWKDRFANKRFSDRQFRYANSKSLSSVYTPGMLINGKEWRKRPWSQLPKANQQAQGKLRVEIKDDLVSAQFDSAIAKNQSLLLNIALLGFDQVSIIKTGENKGKTLEHNFVVLDYKTVAMQPTVNSFQTPAVKFNSSSVSGRTALATWVSRITDQTPVQAVGGWLK